jgi:phosphocarrier protein HPr
MWHQQVTIVNKLGLHARAAAKFVTVASRFECEIVLARGQRQVNGKSIMGVMMLAASQGTPLDIIATGDDEREAVDRLVELVQQRFGEAE